jgi:hypothetical protein
VEIIYYILSSESHGHNVTEKFIVFLQNSGIEKAFLFDVVSKIYIATDSSPVEMQMYELCCDMIDVVLDVSCIYGLVYVFFFDTQLDCCFKFLFSCLVTVN